MASEQHHPDGWLQDGSLLYRLTDDTHPVNRDEINVAMADGSRSMESCTRRAGELLDSIRAGQAALFAAADTSELPNVPDSVLCYVHAYGGSAPGCQHFRRAVRYGLVQLTPGRVRFYFERVADETNGGAA